MTSKVLRRQIYRLRMVQVIEYLIAIAVIISVTSFIINKSSGLIKEVKVVAGAVDALQLLRSDMSVYYAVNGEWPEDMAKLREAFPEGKRNGTASLRKYSISKGTIDATIPFIQGNEVLTLHPAYLKESQYFGPIKWVAGKRSINEGWTVVGGDRSTVEDSYIIDELKQ